MPPAIEARGLGKRYQLSRNRGAKYRTLQEDLVAFVKSPGSVFRKEAREEFWALSDVSFDTAQGEAIGIVGRNGAGKSTLLKLLSRITEPTSGFADIYGRVGSLLEVGTGFHPELTGRENVFLSGAILGMRRGEIARRFDEIVAFAEVERHLETPVKRYSSGMYMRLAFAVAAHLEPEILAVDEVLAVGDAEFQKKCLGRMSTVASEGRTVLFVSHNMAAVTRLTTRSILLESGRLVADGPSNEIVQTYLAGGSPESALLDGTWHDLRRARHVAGSRELVEIERLSIAGPDGVPRMRFRETEPIRMTVAIRAKAAITGLEVAINIRSADSSRSLFVVPSGQVTDELEPGLYQASMRMDPNHLREGTYTVAIYAFVRNHKEDVVAPAAQFDVDPHSPAGANPFHLRWGTGEFRFDYPWDGFTREPEVLTGFKP